MYPKSVMNYILHVLTYLSDGVSEISTKKNSKTASILVLENRLLRMLKLSKSTEEF